MQKVPISIVRNQLETVYDEPATVPMRLTIQMSMADWAKLACGEDPAPEVVRRLRWELASWVLGAYKARGLALPPGLPTSDEIRAALAEK